MPRFIYIPHVAVQDTLHTYTTNCIESHFITTYRYILSYWCSKNYENNTECRMYLQCLTPIDDFFLPESREGCLQKQISSLNPLVCEISERRYLGVKISVVRLCFSGPGCILLAASLVGPERQQIHCSH